MRMPEVSLKLLRKIINNHRKLLVLQDRLTDFQDWSLVGGKEEDGIEEVETFTWETYGIAVLGQLIIDQGCFLVLPSCLLQCVSSVHNWLTFTPILSVCGEKRKS